MADMGENELEVRGDMAELRRFRDRADARLAPPPERDPYNGSNPTLLSFHRLLPVPADVAARDYGAPGGGYEWQKTNWGVKWGASGARLSEEADSLIYSFETAWSAPLAWLQTVSADYPALMFLLTFSQPITHGQEAFAFRNGAAIDVE